MKIVLCSSIDFTDEIKRIADELTTQGHQVEIPLTSQRIINGELTMEEYLKEKANNGDGAFRKIHDNVIKMYYDKIKNSDAILVVNMLKKGVDGYIGGNTFLEMGFAHVLDKKIFLLNPIPEMPYKDELQAMQPIVLEGDLSQLN